MYICNLTLWQNLEYCAITNDIVLIKLITRAYTHIILQSLQYPIIDFLYFTHDNAPIDERSILYIGIGIF